MKYQKIITLNDQSFDVIHKAVNTLLFFIKEYNHKNSLTLEFFSIRTKDSEKCPFSIDMVLDWQVKVLREKNEMDQR